MSVYSNIKNAKHSQSVVNTRINKKNRLRTGRYKDIYIVKPGKICNNTKIIRSDGFKLCLTNINTLEKLYFNSARDLAVYCKCSPSAVHRALNKNRPMLKKFIVIKDDKNRNTE